MPSKGGSLLVSTVIVIFAVVGILAVQNVLPDSPTDGVLVEGEIASMDPMGTQSHEEVTRAILARCPVLTENRQVCIEQGVLDLAKSAGPKLSIAVLTLLRDRGDVRHDSDYHDFVHKIGRLTAKTYGVNTKAFFRCPTDFNYGCPHGFFEAALAENPNYGKVSQTICDPSEMTGMPEKTYFYCYHGVGHGVMMAKAYRLTDALAVCDSFPDALAQRGCWQGLFMENVVGKMQGTFQSQNFSETDLLAPCSTVGSKYATECYINHAGYLMVKTENSVRAAAQACLAADSAGQASCVQGVGLMATNPGWQVAILPPEKRRSFIENAMTICHEFPEEMVESCFDAGIDNLANNEPQDLSHALALCEELDLDRRSRCFSRIGFAYRHEIPTGDPGTRICDRVPEAYRAGCFDGIKGRHVGT